MNLLGKTGIFISGVIAFGAAMYLMTPKGGHPFPGFPEVGIYANEIGSSTTVSAIIEGRLVTERIMEASIPKNLM